MVPTRLPRAARILAAVPVLFALVYATCPQGGFSLSVRVAGLQLAASTCRA